MAGSETATRSFDVATSLSAPADAAAYLSAARAENDSGAFRRPLDDVVRARGMAAVPEPSGLGRESQ
ncbi:MULTISPECIES: hypothetical protein [unclassified Methylobacterium]|uniref:hypothetical protein n=1 Tax=unclassified Methylobacterium TaxID=2615210 RepID=UPI001FF07593|nr:MULTISPECIES: hypothetical protein [unclassified Methylobacterium]